MKRLSGWDAMLLYIETPNVHMHTIKAGILDVSGVDATPTIEGFARSCRVGCPARPAALRVGRRSAEVSSSDVARACRGRFGVSRPAVAAARSGRTAGIRRGHRRDRKHSAGPRQAVVDDVLRRGSCRRQHCCHRQGSPCAGRWRCVRQFDGARNGLGGHAGRGSRLLRIRPAPVASGVDERRFA